MGLTINSKIGTNYGELICGFEKNKRLIFKLLLLVIRIQLSLSNN